MFATLGVCLSLFTTVIYIHSMVFTAVMMFYNTGWQQYHQMGVNYHGKKLYWIRITAVKSFTVQDAANEAMEKVTSLNNPWGPFASLSLLSIPQL